MQSGVSGGIGLGLSRVERVGGVRVFVRVLRRGDIRV